MQLEAGCHGVHFLIVVVGLPLLNRNHSNPMCHKVRLGDRAHWAFMEWT